MQEIKHIQDNNNFSYSGASPSRIHSQVSANINNNNIINYNNNYNNYNNYNYNNNNHNNLYNNHYNHNNNNHNNYNHNNNNTERKYSSHSSYSSIGSISDGYSTPRTSITSFTTSVTTLASSSSSITLNNIDQLDFNNTDELYELPEFQVISILQRDDLEMPEIDIWNGLIAWGIKNTPSINFDDDTSKWSPQDFMALQSTLKNCMHLIRFFQINTEDFARYVAPYKQIIPQNIIGNFLRQKITGHLELSTKYTSLPPRIPPTLIDSTIITGRHASILSSWINKDDLLGRKPLYKFNLLYRASHDGISSKIFNRKCDNHGSTIIIVKLSGLDQIVGGYNPISYRRRDSFVLKKNKKDDNLKQKDSFIFSFGPSYYPEETAIISKVGPQFIKETRLIKSSLDGPCFGLGPDLFIKLNKSDERKVHHCVFTYENRILNHEDVEWDDIEVFQVEKKE